MRAFRPIRLLVVPLCAIQVAEWLPARAVARQAPPSAGAAPRAPGGGPGAATLGAPSIPDSTGLTTATWADSAQAIRATLDLARQLHGEGAFDSAIVILRPALARAQGHPELLRDVYLMLIKTYVFIRNELWYKHRLREASNLNYLEARKLTEECLRVRELRHTRPQPADSPPEMIDLFDQVRREIFGSFKVASLEPRDAVVILAGDTLRATFGDGALGDTDLDVGQHRLVVRAKGYKTHSADITISPNATLAGTYRLARKRSAKWYAVVSLGVLGVVAAIVALAGRSSTPEPLPEPPPPPSPS